MRQKERRKYIFICMFVVGIVIFISYTLSQFHSTIQQRVYHKQIETMKNISMQGSAVVEKKLGGMVNTLYGLAEYVKEEDINSSTNVKRLQKFLEQHDVGFQRIGIADANGNAKVTNGEQLNVRDRQYFQTCMEEKHGATEIKQSELVDEPVCIVAVPILKEDEEAKGVLYGVTELSAFRIYDDTILEDKNQYIQIIDTDGNYIRKQVSHLIGKKDNIFEGIRLLEGKNTAEAIRRQVQKEEQVYTEVSNGEAHEILYFTPLKLNNWCIVTVLEYKEVAELVDYILKDDTYVMTLKVIFAIVLFSLLLLYYSWQERKKVKDFNEKLVMDDKIVSIAAEKAGFAIMSYDVKSKQLRFVNDALRDVKFPKQIENAPKEIGKYLSDNRKIQKQIQDIFNRMPDIKEKTKIPFVFQRDGKDVYLNIQLIPLIDSNGEIRQFVGVMEDGEEEKKLRDKADIDSLTGLYNRSSASEKISDYLSHSDMREGTVHAYMIMDLDNFKMLNDTFGHQMGDRALRDVAEILMRHFRNYDVVSRLGGDEFLVFMKGIPEEAVRRNIASLLKKLTLTYEEDGKSVQITASAGIALISDRNMDIQEMYRRADEALYQVKHEAKNGFKIYEKYETASEKDRNTRCKCEQIAASKETKLPVQDVDNLTGLWNTEKFMKDFGESLRDNSGYLMIIGIDNFQNINMKGGRRFGNELLKRIAGILKNDSNELIKSYRLDGDRFAVNFVNKTKEEVTDYYVSVREKVKQYCTISAGIVKYESDDKTESSLLYQYAESALSRAKEEGKDKMMFFAFADYQKALDKIQLQDELYDSMKHNYEGFSLCYQPQRNANTLDICGAEALLRYESSQRGMVSPVEFIPILEQSGKICEVGEWVLKTALRTCAKWREHVPDFHINVNISYVQLRQKHIVETVLAALHEAKLPGSALTLEVTESMQLQDYEYFNQIFSKWKREGIQIAIDDFGTGYSSLSYLKSMEADEMKIDRSFVSRLQSHTFHYHLLSHMIAFAHSAQMRVCCEGVETEEELRTLRELNPDVLQGYLLGKPYLAEEFEKTYMNISPKQ